MSIVLVEYRQGVEIQEEVVMKLPHPPSIRSRSRRRAGVGLLAAGALAWVLAGCGSDSANTATEEGDTEGVVTLRLGYFGNLTHAPAIVGVEEGLFSDAVGPDVEIETVTFNSGTEAIEALFAGAIDATFIGPNPAINGFAQSGGEALRIVAGTTSGGAALVVREGITDPNDLRGTTLSTPSLGNTQDVALRAWLTSKDFSVDAAGGGDVTIAPQENADTLAGLIDGSIDGAWVPEPWATRLVLEGGGHVLVDEADLWPEGKFVTTHLVVATGFLSDHPKAVRGLVEGLLDSLDLIESDPGTARSTTNDGIERVTSKRLGDATIESAWKNLTFTYDPIASSLERSKDDAVKAGLLDEVDLDGIYDLGILNEVLEGRGLDPVEAP
jgi:NitT/TauT family transport system substrate-binding protein